MDPKVEKEKDLLGCKTTQSQFLLKILGVSTSFLIEQWCDLLIFPRSKRCWKQLGQRTLHRRGRTRWFSSRCRSKRGWRLRLSSRLSAHALVGWWNWLWYGNTSHFQDQRRIPRQNHEHFQRCTISKSIRHRCGALQRHTVRPSVSWKHRWNILHR